MTTANDKDRQIEDKIGLSNGLFAIKIGQEILNQFDKEMSKRCFTYKDFQELQDNYEEILEEEIKKKEAEMIQEELDFLTSDEMNSFTHPRPFCPICSRINELSQQLKAMQGGEKE